MENKLEKIGQNNFMDNFVKTDDILKDMCGIIESSQKAAYRAVNTTLIQRNWLLGYRIASEELQGEDRAKYGAEIIKKLAKELSAEYGKGYTKSNLYSFYSFYKTYPEIFQTPSGKSVGLLSWSHYATLLQVKDKAARDWYEKEATEQTWSVRTLQRNISSQYYYRMLGTQKKELVESEMKELTAPYQNDKLEFIKNPVVAEFLGFSQNTDFTESDLEKSILSNLQKYLRLRISEVQTVICTLNRLCFQVRNRLWQKLNLKLDTINPLTVNPVSLVWARIYIMFHKRWNSTKAIPFLKLTRFVEQ